MLNEILTLGICIASGSGLLDIREPSRAVYNGDYLAWNGTDYDLEINSIYLDSTLSMPANQKTYITQDTTKDMEIMSTDQRLDSTSRIWYCVFDGPNIPQTPTWVQQPWGSYFTIPGSSVPNYGFGVYKEVDIPTNVNYYIDPALWGGISVGLTDWTGERALMPPNSILRIYKEDGTYAQLTNLYVKRTKQEKNNNYLTIIYSNINDNQKMMLANNYGVTNQYFNGFSAPTTTVNTQPYLKYYNGFTNRVTFASGIMEKNPFAENGKGYNELNTFGLNEYVTGYMGQSDGGVNEAVVSITTGMGFVASSFIVVSQFFNYMIFPGLSLGLLLCIPLIMTLILAIIKIIKKGG